jgi:Right handed beta helix region
MSHAHTVSIAGPIVLIGALTLAPDLQAATLHVCPTGCAFSTIQSAVDDAASGDVIQIASGRYVGKVTVIGKRLTLTGAADGPATEIVGIGGQGPALVLGSGAGSGYEEVDVEYVTISGGDHQTGSGVGGGVQVRRGAFLHLLNSVVTRNSALFGGGIGIDTPGGPLTTVSGCVIDDNSATTTNGLGGGGIVVVQGSAVLIQQSTIARNRALNGGGVYADVGTHLEIEHATVTENAVSQIHRHLGFVGGTGGGVSANSELAITDSIVADNSATGEEVAAGAGLFVVLGAKQTITRTIIAHNSASGSNGVGDGGGIFTASENVHNTLTLTQVYVVENQAAPGAAGGISNGGTLVLSGTVIKDNSGVNCQGGFGCPP